MRYAPIGQAVRQAIAQWNVPSTTQQEVLGKVVDAVDNYWGYGVFVYAKAANAINVGNLVSAVTAGIGGLQVDKCPNVANQGFPVFVAISEFASGAFGWFLKAGMCVVKSNATVAAGASVGLTAAGVIGAFAAGKQIVSYNQLASQTATLVKTNVQTFNGYGYLICPNGYDGFFLGAALSGTGIPASTVVAGLDPDGKTVYTGSAVGTFGDKNSTASGAVTVTATYTGYSVAHVDSPFAQGQIT